MSHVLRDISCQMEWRLLHKECHNCIKILISKCQRFSACASWFTKDQEGHKIYWASGNRVLDTFSTIQYMTICCLCHANVIMPSAMWLEFSNLRVAPSQVTKMSLTTLDLFYTHTWKFGHTTSPKCVLCCSWSLHPNSVLNLHLRHSCMIAYSQTGRTFSIFFKCTLLLPITKPSSAPSFHDYFLIWGTVCVKLLHGQTSISLMLVSIQLLICCLQFLQPNSRAWFYSLTQSRLH